MTPEHRAKISAARRGYVMSIRQRNKISETLKGRQGPTQTVEMRAKTSVALRRYRQRMPEEHKRRLAEAVFKAHCGIPSWNTGLTKETDMRVARNAIGVKEHVISCTGACHNSQNPSALAWAVYDTLLSDFRVVVPEARLGPYSIDFLLAEEWLGIEVDGSYWHSKPGAKERDVTRDTYLLEKFQLPIVRIGEHEAQAFRRGD